MHSAEDALSGTRPAADAPVIDPSLVEPSRRCLIPSYSDDIWTLLAINDNPSAANEQLRWSKFPDGFREPMRHAAWAMVNFHLPDEELAALGPAARSKLGVSRLVRTVIMWATFARWIENAGIATLSEVRHVDLTRFSFHLARERGLSRNTVIQHLVALTRLHVYSAIHLHTADRLPRTPWADDGMDDYLPAASAGGENVTEPITPDTLGPLLIWSLRMVEDLSQDILAAREERQRLVRRIDDLSSATGRGGLEQHLTELMAAGLPVPSHRVPGGRTAPATKFLAATTDTPIALAYSLMRQPKWRDYAREHPGPSAVPISVTGRVAGSAWCEVVEFSDVPNLTKRLVDACFIVIAYLTGMRPGEVLGLEYGCCPEPRVLGTGTKRYVINARTFKTARDEHGNHRSAGELRDAPWVAVPQVVRAIRVLERLVGPGRLLFDAVTTDERNHFLRNGRAMATTTVANRIENTVPWFNELARRLGREDEAIPPDPEGRIGVARFRRTLAWHIARRPGGLVALALQYGHMRTVVSEGYSARARGGIHQLLDIETARTVAEHLTTVHDALQEGHGVSGPAARRLIHSAQRYAEHFDGVVLTHRQAKTLLADPTLTVFDNPDAYLTCNYDPSKALCQRDKTSDLATPALDRCQDHCANIARTDAHAKQMELAADGLLAQARSGLLPEPLAARHAARAEALRKQADCHITKSVTTERRNCGTGQ